MLDQGHVVRMNILTILLIVLLVMIVFGGFGYSRRGR
jgi:flagellar basal body-associated protein FliL